MLTHSLTQPPTQLESVRTCAFAGVQVVLNMPPERKKGERKGREERERGKGERKYTYPCNLNDLFLSLCLSRQGRWTCRSRRWIGIGTGLNSNEMNRIGKSKKNPLLLFSSSSLSGIQDSGLCGLIGIGVAM